MSILKIQNLVKSYASPDGERFEVIRINEFTLEAGDQMAVRGASGSGKTTFLHLIAGILHPDAGEVLINGKNMTGISESRRDALRSKEIGYIFQTFNLLQGYTVLENICMAMLFGEGIDRKRAEFLLARVDMSNRLHYFPRQLSVGQQQRVAVARALANAPKLVLADEPTGNLDERHAGETIHLIREICRENHAALLLVSHDSFVLDRFDSVVKFSDLNQVMSERVR